MSTASKVIAQTDRQTDRQTHTHTHTHTMKTLPLLHMWEVIKPSSAICFWESTSYGCSNDTRWVKISYFLSLMLSS